MSIIFNKYINSRDHTWYDSSNVKYSECIDNDETKKVLKVTFKGGQTYIYRDVDVSDYVLFKNAESTGKAFNEHIKKKYTGIRLSDIDLASLDDKMNEFANDTKVIDEALTNLAYVLEFNAETKEFRLTLNGKTIFEGVDNNFSISKLLSSMSIKFGVKELTEPIKKGDDDAE